MAWMKVLSFFFNLIGVLFLAGGLIVIVLGTGAGGSAGNGLNSGAVVGAFIGGMMGTMAVLANFLAALGMFFFGAVLWALQAILAELQRVRPGVA